MTEPPVRNLIVTGQKELATLPNGSVLYEVFCTDEHGERLDQPFRSFMELPHKEVVEMEVIPHDSEEWGRTFTLRPKARESRTAQLTRKVRDLEHRLNEFENSLPVLVREEMDKEIKRIEQYGGKAPW